MTGPETAFGAPFGVATDLGSSSTVVISDATFEPVAFGKFLGWTEAFGTLGTAFGGGPLPTVELTLPLGGDVSLSTGALAGEAAIALVWSLLQGTARPWGTDRTSDVFLTWWRDCSHPWQWLWTELPGLFLKMTLCHSLDQQLTGLYCDDTQCCPANWSNPANQIADPKTTSVRIRSWITLGQVHFWIWDCVCPVQ